jgi:hypothetical protein
VTILADDVAMGPSELRWYFQYSFETVCGGTVFSVDKSLWAAHAVTPWCPLFASCSAVKTTKGLAVLTEGEQQHTHPGCACRLAAEQPL